MESTGVYGDTLRRQLREAGREVHLMSAKRVHDACEVYDGVPSMHDAKAAQVIGGCTLKGRVGCGWKRASSSAATMPSGGCTDSTRSSTSSSRTGWRRRCNGTGRS